MPSFRDSNFPAISDHQTDMTGKRNETRSLLEWRTRLRRCPRGIANTYNLSYEGGHAGRVVRVCAKDGGGGVLSKVCFILSAIFTTVTANPATFFHTFKQWCVSFSLFARFRLLLSILEKKSWLWTVWWLFGHKKDHQGDRSWTDKLKNLTSTQNDVLTVSIISRHSAGVLVLRSAVSWPTIYGSVKLQDVSTSSSACV